MCVCDDAYGVSVNKSGKGINYIWCRACRRLSWKCFISSESIAIIRKIWKLHFFGCFWFVTFNIILKWLGASTASHPCHLYSSDIYTNWLPRAETVEMAEMPETVSGPLFIANCMAVKCISKSRSISIFSNPGNVECIYGQEGRAMKHAPTHLKNLRTYEPQQKKFSLVNWCSLNFSTTKVATNTKNRYCIVVFD